MKNFSLLVCFSLLCTIALKSNAQSTSWFLSASSTAAINIQKVVLLQDNSIVLTGTTPDPNDSSFYQLSYFLVARIAEDGTVMWAKKSTEPGYTINGMNVINDEIYVSLNYMNYDSAILKSEIMKLDLFGNVSNTISIVTQAYGQYAENKFLKLPDNNIVLLRSMFYEFEIQCFDPNLNLLWSRRVQDSTAGKNPAMNICLDNSGNLFICGKRESSLELLSMTTTGQFIFGKTFDDSTMLSYLRAYNVFPVSDGYIIQGMLGLYAGSSFVVKTNVQGDIIWMKNIEDANNSNYNFSITNGYALQNGHFIFSGNTMNGRNVIGEMDDQGNIVWSKMLEANGISYYSSAALSLNGNNIASTYSKNIYPYGDGTALLKTNIGFFSSADVCGFIANSVTASDLVIGFTVNNVTASHLIDFPSTYSNEIISLYDFTEGIDIMEICSNVGVINVESNHSFGIYPIPASDILKIHFDNPSMVSSLNIYDVLGKLIFSLGDVSKSELSVPVTDLASGVYSIRIESKGNSFRQKFVVQH